MAGIGRNTYSRGTKECTQSALALPPPPSSPFLRSCPCAPPTQVRRREEEMLPPSLIFAPRHHPCRSSHCLIRRAASGVHFFVAPQGSAVCPAAKERVQFFNIWKWGWAKNEGEGGKAQRENGRAATAARGETVKLLFQVWQGLKICGGGFAADRVRVRWCGVFWRKKAQCSSLLFFRCSCRLGFSSLGLFRRCFLWQRSRKYFFDFYLHGRQFLKRLLVSEREENGRRKG